MASIPKSPGSRYGPQLKPALQSSWPVWPVSKAILTQRSRNKSGGGSNSNNRYYQKHAHGTDSHSRDRDRDRAQPYAQSREEHELQGFGGGVGRSMASVTVGDVKKPAVSEESIELRQASFESQARILRRHRDAA